MKILVIGTGGREHAIIWKLTQSENVEVVYTNSNNPGILGEKKVQMAEVKSIPEMIAFAKANDVTFTVVGPENPLMDGIGNSFREAGLRIFAPDIDEANLEGSKEFAKEFMKEYGVAHSHSESFHYFDEAKEYLKKVSYPTVIKASGLCAGKGVIICKDLEEANIALREMMLDKIFSEAGSSVVIEDYMTGKEISILSIYDGKNIFPMISSMDHKKIGEGETGLNTGGMGTIAPSPYFNDSVKMDFIKNILEPTLKGLKARNFTTPACIFFGLMLTENGVKCMEYNMRFGDPETQSVLYLLKSDLAEIFSKAIDGILSETDFSFEDKTAVTVVGAAEGYPKTYKKNIPLNFKENKDLKVFIAGAYNKDGKIYSNGGRIFNVTSAAETKEKAREIIYKYMDEINNPDIYFRRDIGNV